MLQPEKRQAVAIERMRGELLMELKKLNQSLLPVSYGASFYEDVVSKHQRWCRIGIFSVGMS
jgi:hypothetical protein